ncbi:Uroporphyrinogen decarboxylase [Anatilimnocola aggregata]|uniref:Uroporphyrinogen decarboxylase n=1 Tax=Anatilimnocola aggregata TaxID=2528021 RepID=A0A517YJY5_9BACT|nr:uroporphyrinogen decarboxylase [Anatilimnocola aggregata]QDU30535.1 Uroporphyrinogen decarboxylase [Anatilimnocola aggregata]
MSNTSGLTGLRVASLESRKQEEIARLIEKFGGQPFVSASLREVPISENREAIDFAQSVVTGGIDVMILLTGVGFRHLLAAVEKHVDRQRFLNSLADIVTICRGPKPVVAMSEVGLKPTHRVPEPNTWRELLATIDAGIPVINQNVGLQEYGVTNRSLIAGLEARGARVVPVRVYQWELPIDIASLEQNIRALCAGERDVLMFTSAHQAVNLLRIAEQLHLLDQLREALKKTVVVSIGPTTSEMLREHDLPVDIEPEHPKMGSMVMAAAEQAAELLANKRRAVISFASADSPPLDKNAAWYNSPFMKACRLEPTNVTPVWLMRQAGRYMEEYRQVRGQTSFLDLCKNPQLCSEVMCTAVRKLGVDAAIIFSDLLPILEPMGLELEFAKGEGPIIYNPVRAPADVDRVEELEDLSELEFVFETVRQTRADLPADLPLIGFAGAPFTLASYTIEGGSSRTYQHTKALMYRDEGAWRTLMTRLARTVTRYLNAQIKAGAQAVQIFDSWVGCLGPDDYRRYVMPYSKMIIDGVTPGVPVINFAAGNPALLPLIAQTGGHVIGIDWRVRLDDAWKTVGYDRAVQGNLDPLVLLGEQKEIRRRVKEVLDQAAGRPGHIFNLGHGVVQQTPVENAVAIIEMVHELSQR